MTHTAADYARRADEHRPKDPSDLRIAAIAMLAEGWTTHDVATVLRLDVPAVLALLADERR